MRLYEIEAPIGHTVKPDERFIVAANSLAEAIEVYNDTAKDDWLPVAPTSAREIGKLLASASSD